jgi:hypothetical protein
VEGSNVIDTSSSGRQGAANDRTKEMRMQYVDAVGLELATQQSGKRGKRIQGFVMLVTRERSFAETILLGKLVEVRTPKMIEDDFMTLLAQGAAQLHQQRLGAAE